MKKGTLLCKLFGHNFHGERVVFEPHYLKGVDLGLVGTRTERDYHLEGFVTDYCVRCGIKEEEK